MKFIKKILLNRILVIGISILAQLLVLIWAILKFQDYFVVFYAVSIVISIGVVLFIINDPINPAYKIAWIIPILLFPIFGGLFYILFGGNKVNKRDKKRMKFIEHKMKQCLPPDRDILKEIELIDKDAMNQCSYLQNSAYVPAFKNTFTEYFPIGELKFKRLKEELKKAKEFIFLEYFIISEGKMWDEILEILKEKASEGLDIRIIYDDFGCVLTLPYGYDKKLESMGIKCAIFNPLIPVLSPKLNNRDHRKIAIIDGHTGFTGGINLADEYINVIDRFGHWKDSAIMIKGDAVWSLTVMFLSMWDYINGIDEDFNKFKKEKVHIDYKEQKGYIQPFTDNPLDDETVGEITYLNLINKAKDYIYITTPYLIIDNEMVVALTSAAKAGIDVKIITPHSPDKWYVHAVTRSFYKLLIEKGIKIYEYTPGFIHSKNFIVDDNYGVVSTINMDYRSLYLHFECGVWMYKTDSIYYMKKDFLDTLEFCKEITYEEATDIKLHRRLGRSILRAFSPLM
ncbi:cardiolipin synthase [Senegalia massiliensis]|uniref:cardiolipin synthase n=1 Tax=Senegalia massiliensis TaxID=1720316 RepID=UPI001030FDA2|nr:cardiolipin synthase [Senegalia massiliensis]